MGGLGQLGSPSGMIHSIGPTVSTSSTLTSRDGEEHLCHEMNVLMFQNGIEYAEDDVSAASFDPESVRQARDLEMKFFNDMGVYD